MARRTHNLERLCNKLERRFGSADPLFLHAKTELETHIATKQLQCVRQDWSKSYSAFIGSFDKESARHPVAENL